MNKKYLIIGILTFLILLLSTTFAWFIYTTSQANNGTVVNSGTLSIGYMDGTIIETLNLMPAAEPDYNDLCNSNLCYRNSFTVSNVGKLDAYITGTIDNINNTFESNKLMYKIMDEERVVMAPSVIPSSLSVTLFDGLTLDALVGTKTYTLLIWLDTSATNESQGKTMTGTININAVQTGTDYVSLDGILYDTNNNVLANTLVELHSVPKYTKTDEDGYFNFGLVPTGIHEIKALDSDNDIIIQDNFVVNSGEKNIVTDKNIIVKDNITVAVKAITDAKIEISEYFKTSLLVDAILNKYVPVSDEIVNFAYTSNGCNAPTWTEGFKKICTSSYFTYNANMVTNGLYINSKSNISNDPTINTIKYFRGNIDNNYIQLGTYKTFQYIYRNPNNVSQSSIYLTLSECETVYGTGNCDEVYKEGDPILWRVIRMDSNNNVRIITDNTPIVRTKYADVRTPQGKCGFTYGDSSTTTNDGTPSIIKTSLDNWYLENLTSYSSIINQSARYCNDTSLNGSPSSSSNATTYYYDAYTRLFTNHAPTFSCPQTNRLFGGEYVTNIATITADEEVYAGKILWSFGGKNETYLYNETMYWTLTPSYYNYFFNGNGTGDNIFLIYGGNYIDTLPPISSYGVRPVIELNSSVRVSGSGSKSDPWVIR